MTSTTLSRGSVTSADGTRLSYAIQGSGPPLLVVHCVSCDRTTTPQPDLPQALAAHFTVISYDRRGTGDSSTTDPYAVQREFEDMAALAELVDGPVDAYGFSSGATLCLLAARHGVPFRRLALLEPPLMAGDWSAQRDRLRTLLDRDRAAAREYYLTEIVGVPEDMLAQMPASERDLANAPSMLHEMEFLPGAGAEAFRGLETPTLLIRSDHAVPEMGVWARELVDVMPHARDLEVPGDWHGVDDATLTATVHDYLVGTGA